MTNDFYVYLHTKKTNGDVFYVGKGRGYRYKSKSGRNDFWKRVVNKHGFNSDILFEGLTESEALDAEINAIKELKAFGVRLCNKVEGGGGTTGWRHSDSTRTQIKANNAKHWEGKQRSKETKEIMSKKKLSNGDSKGNKNPSYDGALYLFLSPSGEIVKSTKYDLYTNNKELNQPYVSRLVSGHAKTAKGWRFISVVE